MEEGNMQPSNAQLSPDNDKEISGNNGYLKFFQKKRNIIYATGLLAVVALAIFLFQSTVLHEELSEFKLTPQASDAAGITSNSTFILESSADLSATVVKKYLAFNPQIEYEIKKAGSGSGIFEITPSADLGENSVYSIKIAQGPIATRDYSWAYQVKAPFLVISSLPRDKSTQVPINTGIEITFNRENLISPEKSFEISPSVPGKFEIHQNVLVFIPGKELNPKTIYTIKVKAGIKAEGSLDTLNEDVEINFETSEKYDYKKPSPYFNFSKTFWEFKPDAEIAFTVNHSNLNSNSALLSVYKFGNLQEFVSSYRNSVNEKYNWTSYNAYSPLTPEADKKVFEADVPIEEQTRVKFIKIPQILSEGFYLADAAIGGVRKQAWFQVTPIAGFSAISGTKTVLWLKDIVNGGNIANAQVSFENDRIGNTNGDGIAIFDTPSKLINDPNNINHYYSSSPYFYTISAGNKEIAIPTENEYGYSSRVSPPDEWWDYFSLDKNIYLPTDKVNFWGIVKQKNGTDIKGEEITVQLTNPFWYAGSDEEITVYGETKSQISDFYTLTGSISFSDLPPGLYQLNVKRGEEMIISESVNVETYIKPAYKITLTADKNAVFAGDTITYKAKAEFFDGTPVANIRLEYDGYYYNQISGEVQLNQDGEGSFEVKTNYFENDYSYWPRYIGIRVSPAVSEEGQISSSVSTLVFGPQIDLRSEQSISNKTSKFDIKLREIVLEKINKGELWWNSDNYLGNPVPSWNITANVEEVIYQRTEIDREYDIVNKVTRPVYQYRTDYRQVKQSALTTDAMGSAHYEWIPEENKSYRITFATKDAGGRAVQMSHYVYGGSFSYLGFYDNRGIELKNLDNKNQYKLGDEVRLQIQDNGGKAIAPGSKNFVFLKVNNGIISYQVSDSPDYSDNFKDEYIPNTSIIGVWFGGSRFINSYPVNLSFDSNDRRLNIEVKKDKEKYRPRDTVKLNIKVTDKNGIPKKSEVNVSGIDEAVFSLNPEEKDITNMFYKDVFASLIIRSSHYSPLFEGGGGAEKGCFTAGTSVLVPDGTQSIENLKIGDEILTWKEGSSEEFVKAKIKRISSHVVNGYFVVNDRLKVTMNHRLLVNGLWKYAGEMEIGDMLLTNDGSKEKIASLKFIPEWTLVYNIELDKYNTYFAEGIYVHNEEKGGGGARTDFRDAVIYQNIQTNQNGEAQVSFNVPDNLTSWRITSQAITKDLYVGKSVNFIPVGLPFFVEASLNRTYLAGDSLNLRVRVFGTANISENISYIVESETLQFKKIAITGGKNIEIPLGKLTQGKHQVKISANTAGFSDAIVRDLEVLTSYFTKNTSEYYDLSPELTNIKGAAKGYTTVLVTSRERGQYYNVLRWLSYGGGVRVDQKLSSWFSESLLNKFFDEDIKVEDINIEQYQINGGITLLPYSDTDLELSAKFANLIKDEEIAIDKELLKYYFNNSLDDRKTDSSRVVAALYGLSAFKEPVLVKLQNIKSDRNLTLMDKIYVALAFDNLGAKEEARNYYKTEIKPALTVKKPFMYVGKLKNQDENILATALLGGLTASLSESESEALGQYAIENRPKETLKNFEILLFLKAALPKLSGGEVSFSWNTSTKNGSEMLENNEKFRLELSSEELATLHFNNIIGRIGLVSNFEEESSPAEIDKDPNIGLSRRYSVDGRSTNEFSDGDLVRIDLTPSFASGALKGAYQIVDYLPSGLRSVTDLQWAPIELGSYYRIYPSEIDDQKITFVIWNQENLSKPFYYYARVVSKGEYKAEPALIQSMKSSSSANISSEASITIK